jgi:energy-converting hydrogenase Eha subunit A
VTNEAKVNSYRTTARIVGGLFLAGMVVYGGGNVLAQSVLGAPDHLATVSANSMLVAVGAMGMLLAAIFDAAHGILMLPILKKSSERLAFGYLGYRIFDGAVLAVGVVFLLLQIPLGSEYLKTGAAGAPLLQSMSAVAMQGHLYAYEIAMMAVGAAGLFLTYGFYKLKLVPRFVAVWGLIGYAVHLSGSALTVVGFDLALMHTIPGGLWELFIGVWLLAKGFNASAFVSTPVKTVSTERRIEFVPSTK